MSDIHEPRLRRMYGSSGGGWRLDYGYETTVWVAPFWVRAPSPRAVRRATRRARAKHVTTHKRDRRVDEALARATAELTSTPETLVERLRRLTRIGEEKP